MHGGCGVATDGKKARKRQKNSAVGQQEGLKNPYQPSPPKKEPCDRGPAKKRDEGGGACWGLGSGFLRHCVLHQIACCISVTAWTLFCLAHGVVGTSCNLHHAFQTTAQLLSFT